MAPMTPPTPTAPPNRVRELRQAKGWSMEKLAREADVSVRSVSRFEFGDNPTYDVLRKIADALGVGLDDLFEKASA